MKEFLPDFSQVIYLFGIFHLQKNQLRLEKNGKRHSNSPVRIKEVTGLRNPLMLNQKQEQKTPTRELKFPETAMGARRREVVTT